MQRPAEAFVGKQVHIHFAQGQGLIGVVEAVGEDGTLFVRQGAHPIWVPPHQVRYMCLVEAESPRGGTEPLL